MKHKHLERYVEFLIVGVAFGVVEDLVAIRLATGEAFNPQMLLIVIGVTLPFAAVSELWVDRKDFLTLIGLKD